MPSLEKFYDSGDSERLLKKLAKLRKLDPEVGKDFEVAIWEAKAAGLDEPYLAFVRKGLDGRNKWQGPGALASWGSCLSR